jgi:hypothetical protein
VPAGDHARLGPEAREQFERVVDARRPLVFERRWYLHCVLLNPYGSRDDSLASRTLQE